MVNKKNVLYLVAGTLATFALLASGVFAAAPYIGFLAPVAALSVGLPFIIGCAVFSVVTIALSYKAISKNKTISEKEAQLADKAKEIEDKNEIISEKEVQLDQQNTEIDNQKKEIEDKNKIISEKEARLNQDKVIKKDAEAQTETISQQDIQMISQKEEIKHKNTSVGILSSIKEKSVSGVKKVYDASVGYTRGALGSVGSRLKNGYDAMPSAESISSQVPSLKTIGWIVGGAGLAGRMIYYVVANGRLDVAGSSSDAIGNPINGTKGGVPILTSVYPRLTMQCQIDEASKKLADANKWYEDNYGTPKEDSLSNKGIFSSICNKVSSVWSSLGNLISGSNESAHNHSEPQWYKNLYKSEDLEEIIDGGVLDNLFFPRVDNDISTLRQQGTLVDSVKLKKLIKERSPSAYPNGSPRIL